MFAEASSEMRHVYVVDEFVRVIWVVPVVFLTLRPGAKIGTFEEKLVPSHDNCAIVDEILEL